MALSGSQKTRIGASLSGVAKKLSISAKSPGIGGGAVLIAQAKSIGRFTFTRVHGRVN